ncbi:MAG: ACT domain-containing protein [Methylococcaceae bacterium]|jgi:glycine cleavage system transcriptional repressor
MQLAVTALGTVGNNFIAEILPLISDCHCTILEIRSTRLAQATACYLLIDGNWNHIAKLENYLITLEKKLEIGIHTLRPETKNKLNDGIPYSLETISLDSDNTVNAITSFLFERNISIEEIIGSSYQAPYIYNQIFSTKFVVTIPANIRLLSLREEFLDFCDQLNIDAILEPIKR